MVGTKQSFRSVGRQRITEKTICKVANGDDGTNIKKPKRTEQHIGLFRESVIVNGYNTKGHATGRLKRNRFTYCALRDLALQRGYYSTCVRKRSFC